MKDEILIGGIFRPIKLKLLGVKKYKELTGHNLIGGNHDLTDIFGNGGKGDEPKYPDPDLIAALVYAMLLNGDTKFDLTVDQVAESFSLADTEAGKVIARVFYRDMYNLDFDKLSATEEPKNEPAPSQPELIGAM